MPIGLDANAIITKLGEMGINISEVISADKIRTAIATVITENNIKLEKDIAELLTKYNEKQHK